MGFYVPEYCDKCKSSVDLTISHFRGKVMACGMTTDVLLCKNCLLQFCDFIKGTAPVKEGK